MGISEARADGSIAMAANLRLLGARWDILSIIFAAVVDSTVRCRV